VIFRDPVERAYSRYWRAVTIGKESHAFHEGLLREEKRVKEATLSRRMGQSVYAYFGSGLYGQEVETFLHCFERAQFLSLLFEDVAWAQSVASWG
jgi:hypothetical protein